MFGRSVRDERLHARGDARVEPRTDDGGQHGEVVVVLRGGPLLEGGVEAHVDL